MRVRDKLIGHCIDVMRRKGVAGSSVSDLLASSGVARRSLYLNFPGGKLELVTSATEVAGEVISSAVRAALRDRSTAMALQTFFDWWKGALTDANFEKGCPIMVAALARDEDPAIAGAAGQAFAQWERLITARLTEDGLAGAEAAELATTVIAATEGAIVLALARSSTEPLDRVCRHLTDLVTYHRQLGGAARRAAVPDSP